jgi:hypothetical protein
MVRVESRSSCPDLLSSAFASSAGDHTVVLLNRSTSPLRVTVEGVGARFRNMEVVDPYHENDVRPAPAPRGDGTTAVLIAPGAIVTLSTVPLGKLPDGFHIPQ